MERILRHKKLLLFLVFTLVFLPTTILGATRMNPSSDQNVCVNGRIYQITEMGRDVNPAHITARDIEKGCLYDTATGRCKTGSTSFKAKDMVRSCALTSGKIGDDDYQFSTCPLESDQNSVTDISVISENIRQEWVPSIAQWKVVITGASGYRIGIVRPQSGTPAFREACLEYSEGECISYGFPVFDGDWLSGNNGTFEAYFNPGDDYALAFYLDNGAGNPCNGAYMGYVQGSAKTAIPNQIRDRAVCVNYRNKVVGSANESIARTLVNECFDDEIEYSLVEKYTDAEINSHINQADNILSNLSAKTQMTDKLQCYFDDGLNSNTTAPNDPNGHASKQKYTQLLEDVGGEYWGALCTEVMTITYEEPKALAAGDGFSYTPVITMTRTCEPVELKKPVWRPRCAYGIECYGGPANHNGEGGAGPNTSFDSCVATCDGGTYSQKCINQCYKQVYEDDTSSSDKVISRVPSYSNNNVIDVRSACNATGTPYICKDGNGNAMRTGRGSILSSCEVINSNHDCRGDGSTYCVSEHCLQFTYLNGCNANGSTAGTNCYEVYKSSTNCVMEDPAVAYQREIDKSYNEYLQVQEAIKKYTSDSLSAETFSASVTDSHSGEVITYKDATDREVQVDVKNYTVTLDGKTSTQDYDVEKLGSVSYQIGIPGNCSNGQCTTRTVDATSYRTTRELTLNLDKAYLSKVNIGDIKYGKKYFDVSQDEAKYYYDGGYKFYSNVNAQGYNILERWPNIIGWDSEDAIKDGDFASQGITQNIYYNFANLGSWKQWSSIDLNCFYGIKACTSLYNDPTTCPPCADGEKNCVNSGGITYIFRPIDLNQPFLEDQSETGRDPRWNWTTSANNQRFNIEPNETRLDIIDKGYSIYNTSNQEVDNSEELDYEIKLTKQNINAIRQYNYEHNNEYLDYDMYCYNDTSLGMNVCKSNFLSGGTNTFGTGPNQYMDLVRRGIIGCNNQTGEQCTRKYVDMTGGSR